jgi:hypothetical protein
MTGLQQKLTRRGTTTDILERGGHSRGPTVTTERALLTNSWTADVETVTTAIAGFTTNQRLASECKVMMFEIAGDAQLHVNVIHAGERADVRGWAGPGRLPDGCVYNRRFEDTPTKDIVRHIREMVFA